MSNSVILCQQADLIPNSGICAQVQGEQIALFYLPRENPQVYAIGNWDPIGKANVLSRGMSWRSKYTLSSGIATVQTTL